MNSVFMYLSKINCTDYLKESDYHKRIIISNNLLKENMKYDVERTLKK